MTCVNTVLRALGRLVLGASAAGVEAGRRKPMPASPTVGEEPSATATLGMIAALVRLERPSPQAIPDERSTAACSLERASATGG